VVIRLGLFILMVRQNRQRGLLGFLIPLLAGLLVIPALANSIGPEEYRKRRQTYAERTKDGITVLFNSLEEDLREYLVDKNFFYLTGFSDPEAILVLSPGHSQHKETLFIPERDPAREKWTGTKAGPGPETAAALRFDRVLPLNQFQSEVTALAAGERKIYTVLPQRHPNRPVSALEGQVEKLEGLFPFSTFANAGPHIAYLRMTKSPAELALLKEAIQITLQGHRAALAQAAPGRHEYEVEAALEYEFRRRGAERPGFPSIVGSGPNSVTLHYDKNTRQMQAGELVVVDIGAEFREYTADVTRTYPVSGKFSGRQREIYSIVLAAQEAALKEVKPGALHNKSGAIHRAAYEYINTHGKDLQGEPLGKYFIHGTSHHLGLDVHDVVNDETRPLEPGMVITVEPGIYIPEENLGVRIEDDVLVTESGYQLLSGDMPRTPEEIEKLMASAPPGARDTR
jgi:Xaa-Pro aminopeptidase